MKNFKEGDRVQFMDELTQGKVLEVRNDQLRVLTEEGFEMMVAVAAVIRIPEKAELASADAFSGVPDKEADQPGRKPVRKGRKERFAPAMEVDLHIEKLVPSTRGMSTYDILDYQLETARRQLEFALRKRLQRMVFIHGVGEGILKAELYTLFRRYEGLRVQDADPQKYGMGATEVYIPQSFLR